MLSISEMLPLALEKGKMVKIISCESPTPHQTSSSQHLCHWGISPISQCYLENPEWVNIANMKCVSIKFKFLL